MKKILMIIAQKGYRDEEYDIPKKTFLDAGFQVVTCSKQKGEAEGKLGGKTQVDIGLDEVNVGEFDAVIFIGGPGAYDYFDDQSAHQIAQNAIKSNKVLGAICIAPVILAKAGVLEGKRATVFESGSQDLEKVGCLVSRNPVEIDGKFITGNGPSAASEFAQKIIENI